MMNFIKQIAWGKLRGQIPMLWCLGLCLIALEVTTIACTNGSLTRNSIDAEMPSMLVIRQLNIGQTFTVRTEDKIEVLLDENPSTGYSWEITELDQNILFASDSSFYSDGAIPGRGGMRKFQFEAKNPGKTVILFQLSQPWEKAKVIEQFQVNIHVVEG